MSNKKSFKSFDTRSSANIGIDVPLFNIDGSPSGVSIKVLGADSDAFRRAQLASRRRMAAKAQEAQANKRQITEAEASEIMEEERIIVLSSLVVSWTFDEPCDEANIREFLKNAPTIAEQIDNLAADRKRFFDNALTSSSNEQKPSAN